MIELTEELELLAKQVNDMFLKLLNAEKTISKNPSFIRNVDLTTKIEKFVWPIERFPRTALNDIFCMFKDELDLLKRNFELRSDNYEKSRSKMENIRRKKMAV